jgi:hypothetical protein
MLETDASDTVVAAVFSQLGIDGEWHPVGYLSKTMSPAECNYAIYDKELLAIVKAFEHWRAELESTQDPVSVVTDHKALEYFMSTKALTARQARWAEILSKYNFRIEYKPGRLNRADPLTRREQDTTPQDELKKKNREQVLLRPEMLSPELQETIQIQQVICGQLELIDLIRQANQTSPELEEYRQLAKKGHLA